MDDPLLRFRREFPILERSTYLVSHSLGAMPRQAQDQLRQYTDTWASRGVRAWAEGWWRMPVSVGDEVGALIGAPAGSVVMHQNVSVCQSLIASCFDFSGPRNKVVYEDLNFPSVMYVYEALRGRGARVEMVPSPDGIHVPLERLLAAIDEQTLLVPVSHVVFRSGFIQDLAAITRRAHEVGALVVADLYQSAGCVPVDVTAWDVDFATGGSVKWLCGGPGAGFLYVAPRLWKLLAPQVTGWMAHARPFAFETGPIEYAQDASRFLHGSPAVPALYAARAGYQMLAQAGIPAIREKSLRQGRLIWELAQERGFTPHAPPDPRQRSGMLILDVPHGDAVARELLRREIIVDFRPGAGIRLSPHFYSTDEELRYCLDQIREIVEHGAWRAHEAESGADF